MHNRLPLFLILLLISISLFSQNARVYEEIVEIKTYPYGDPDPVPRPGKIYPYFRFDSFTVDAVQKEWKMVCLENQYIKVWIAPEIGGKVYGALDKTKGEYFIYYNNVVKFRDIAMRGPWTSGGIEMNFGTIGHSPTTSSPVDYHMQINPDSSVSCFVGAVDLPSRTNWLVEVYLPSDRPWFETRACWINPGMTGTSLYHWMNASADVTEDLRYYFPGSHHIDHSGNLYKWPINKDGRDISLYRNNNFGADHSYHVMGEYTDWFAGYYEERDFGFAHWTLYPVKPGKKIWMWALSRQGAIWENLLTDTASNGQYTEIQTGLLYNQAGSGSTYSPFKHLEFEPGSELYFSERWFPVSNISGLKSITDELALNIIEENEKKRILIYALSEINDTIDIFTDNEDMISEKVIAMPADTLSFLLENNIDIKTIKLRNRSGYVYERNPAVEVERPLKSRDFNWNSVYGYYYQSLEYARQRYYLKAEEYIQKCIEQDRFFMPAYTLLADLRIRQYNYDEARELLERVLAFNAYDPDANILFGNLAEKSNSLASAMDAYGIAMKSAKYHDLCLNRLALINIAVGDYDRAEKYLDMAYLQGVTNRQIMRTRLVWSRKTGSDSLFRSVYEIIIDRDPLDHHARFEKYLTNPNDSLRDAFTASIRNEFPNQSYLELACWYMNNNMFSEARELLELAPKDALIALYRAYVYDKLGEVDLASASLDEFEEADTDFVFPYREETEKLLRWTAEKVKNWKAMYYQALLYWNSGNRQKADWLFKELGNEPDKWEFYIARGDFTLPDNDILAERDYREAYRLAPGEWRISHKLINFYLQGGFTSRALELSTEAYDRFKGNYIIDFDHARCLLSRDSIYSCIKVLEETVILPHEGARQGREVWKRANVLAAIDKYWYGEIDEALAYIERAYDWPENLGVGKPYDTDERIIDFVMAMIITKKGKIEEARNLYRKVIVDCTDKHATSDPFNILKVFAMREINQNRESDNYFNEWLESLQDKRARLWAESLYEGRYEEAEEYALSEPEVVESDPWEDRAPVTDLSLLHRVVKKYLQEKW